MDEITQITIIVFYNMTRPNCKRFILIKIMEDNYLFSNNNNQQYIPERKQNKNIQIKSRQQQWTIRTGQQTDTE